MTVGQPVGVGVGMPVGYAIGASPYGGWTAAFINGSSPSNVGLTRSTTGRYWNSAGVLTSAAIDTPRYDYDPSTLAPRGLLIEGARTNLNQRSSDLTNAAWWQVVDNASRALDGGTAPDGVGAFTTVTEGVAGTAVIRTSTCTITSGATVTASIFLKRGNTDFVCVSAGSAFGIVNGARTWVNLSTGDISGTTALGTGTGVNATVVALQGSVYRVTLTYAVSAVTGALMSLNTASASGSTTRVNNGTFLAWGGQIEEGAFASSYIPTTSAAATRAADVPLVSNLASIGYNQSEGTMLAEYEMMALSATSQRVAAFSDGTSSELIVLTYSGSSTARMVVTDGGVSQANVTCGTSTALTTTKLAGAYKVNDFASVQNGGTVGTDASGTIPTIDRLYLGIGETGSTFPMFGWMRSFTYYPTRLPNTQLQAITT